MRIFKSSLAIAALFSVSAWAGPGTGAHGQPGFPTPDAPRGTPTQYSVKCLGYFETMQSHGVGSYGYNYGYGNTVDEAKSDLKSKPGRLLSVVNCTQ